MEKEEAIRLIEGMGLEIETGIMDLDNVESGLICHCYPSPGNLLTEDTVVHLHIEKQQNGAKNSPVFFMLS